MPTRVLKLQKPVPQLYSSVPNWLKNGTGDDGYVRVDANGDGAITAADIPRRSRLSLTRDWDPNRPVAVDERTTLAGNLRSRPTELPSSHTVLV